MTLLEIINLMANLSLLRLIFTNYFLSYQIETNPIRSDKLLHLFANSSFQKPFIPKVLVQSQLFPIP
ncbi:hypothetical protein SAMN06296036_107246 [Pseudobacteriovorax antillogorgiicola]|uniref:Uncharacterized protein n=1 Tax=Pseudobacteriovorax antillogorgiicola TaxID=1513793 RepID=A0A1Y6BVD6_9BACT|nr:hypothetical protein EDD56_10726 [Pseudobacteriovorax antillogorgiicola]SMF22878.1 hypothetical protein SAMN06296036_107246 [Pseudobacteriovorax antillogorgiicola]